MTQKTRELLEKRRDRRSLLEIALDVHMTTTGNSERSLKAQDRDVEALRLALDTWEHQLCKYEDFDNAVRALIKAALDEHEEEERTYVRKDIRRLAETEKE